MSTNAQQNKSANKNKYKTLNPLDAIIKAIIERAIMKYLEDSLAEEVLSEKIKAGDTAVVDVGEDNKVKVLPPSLDLENSWMSFTSDSAGFLSELLEEVNVTTEAEANSIPIIATM